MSKAIAALGAVIVTVLAIAAVFGYIVNIVELTAYSPVFGIEEALQVLGIFALPLGAVMGWVAL